jgi:signal transduction histidine kinase
VRADGVPALPGANRFDRSTLSSAPSFTDHIGRRIGERQLIAQELHDTLLQGIFSVSTQLHVALTNLPPNLPSKLTFGRILQLMSRVIDESRAAIQGLRSSRGDVFDLEQLFGDVRDELGPQLAIELRIVIEGRPRPLRASLRDEVYWIGREAIVNASRHSGAKRIETELEYGCDQLRIVVRDDGLQGMRERAERISARLRVVSRASNGTEIELCVPALVAFEVDPSETRTNDERG